MDAVTVISMFVCVVAGLAGILLNSLLVYLIIKKTSRELRSYSIITFNFAVSDLVASIFSILTQARIIPSNHGIFFVFYGPCKIFGVEFCYVANCIMLHCYPHSLYNLLLSFYYRRHVLSHTPLTKRTLLLIIFVFYIPCFLQLVFSTMAIDNEADVRRRLKEFVPYELSNECVGGILDPTNWRSLYTQVHFGAPLIPVYIVILLLRRSIIVQLNTRKMSEQTRHMHSQLLKAITIQACTPMLFAFSTANVILSELGIYRSPLLEFSAYLSVGFIPMLTALLSLYFIAPYRMWLIAKLPCRGQTELSKKAIAQITVSSAIRKQTAREED